MKKLVYTFGVLLSVFVAINISIVSLVIITLLSGFSAVVIAAGLEIFGIVMAIAVFELIRHRIVKSYIADN